MGKKKGFLICILAICMLCLGFCENTYAAAKKSSIKLNKSKATIYTSGKKTVQLKATVKGPRKKVTWKSSNKKIATVNSKGKVTAKKAGTVKITAKANGKVAKCTISVKAKASKRKHSISEIKKKVQAYVKKNFYKCTAGEEFEHNGKYVFIIRSQAGYSSFANVLVGGVTVDPYSCIGIYEPNWGPKEIWKL